MPKLDKNILNAIKKAVEREGSQAALCKKTGISTSIMSRYLKQEVETINLGTWNLLIPEIAPFLPEHYGFSFPPVSEETINKTLEEFPDGSVAHSLRMHNKVREELDIAETFKTDPRFLSSDEKVNTIKTLTDKAYYLTTDQVNSLLVAALTLIKKNQEENVE